VSGTEFSKPRFSIARTDHTPDCGATGPRRGSSMTASRHSSWWLAACFLVAGCGTVGTSSTGGSSPAASARSSSTATPASTTAPAAASSPAAASVFSCSPQSGGDATLKAQLTDVRIGRHPGYDQVTFEFAAPKPGEQLRGIPAYTLSGRSSTRFVHDASGVPVTLQGSVGLLMVAQGSSGWDTLTPTLVQTYKGSLDFKPGFPVIREVAEVGDFERVLSWGVGLASNACFHVITLSHPMRLVIEVQAR
jgi:hypothetical protein